MVTDDVKRKLTAIFSADVEGYSRLMEEDELATVETLTSHKETMRKLIRQYRGRVVDSTGDNLLAEFSSVVDAVQCAVEVQQVLSSKNEAIPENRRMYFRIGINSGDVIEEGEVIYGNGVNVAARVESLAEGGGISISGTAFDQLGKKLPLGYEYLGEQSVKNIRKPVRVYRVLTEEEAVGKVIGEKRAKPKRWRWAAVGAVAVLIVVAGAFAIWNYYFRPTVEPASVEKMAFPLPDEPSIAVLPFVNMSGDPEQEYFSDGLSDQIITALSKAPHLFVIARNSTFTYKGKSVKVQKVAEELGVRYILEGSVQKTADRIRITAQLIDATTGRHLWAERYDRDLKDIFAVQDEITFKILAALQVKLTAGEKMRLVGKGTNNLEAYQKCLLALEIYQRFTKEGNIQARQLAEEAIALDPDYPVAVRLVAWTHLVDARYGWSKSRSESFKRAVEFGQKTLEMDDTQAGAHSLLSLIYLAQKQYEKAIAEGERAVSISPNGAHFNAILAQVLNYSGRPEEAIEYVKKAMRLSPIYPAWFLHRLGMAYRLTGQYDEAIEALKRFRERNPEHPFSYTELAIAYGQSGRMEEANALLEQLLNKKPKFCLESYAKTRPFKDHAELGRELDVLRKAGLPETPPLPLPDKPSIAVLPFVNMSGDPEQEYFSDGITESIITGLSKTPKLLVIARNSTFTYKGKPTNVQKVGRELGVCYVLEGSVQKSGDRLRITAQLVDAKSGNHVWAERYDRDLKDIFALQDEITMKIITELQVKLTEGERVRVYSKGTANLDAYMKFLKGVDYYYQMNEEANRLSRQMFEQAIALDPEYPYPYVMFAWTHMMDVHFGSSMSPRESINRAAQLAQKALTLDNSLPQAHSLVGFILTIKRQYEKAIARCEKAVTLAPNASTAHAMLGRVLHYAGGYEESVAYFDKAIRLDPFPPNWYLIGLGAGYQLLEKHEQAVEEFKKVLSLNPDDILTHIRLAVTYSLLGQEEEARAEAKEVLRLNPKFSVDHIAKKWPYKNKADTELIVNALRKAGLK